MVKIVPCFVLHSCTSFLPSYIYNVKTVSAIAKCRHECKEKHDDEQTVITTETNMGWSYPFSTTDCFPKRQYCQILINPWISVYNIMKDLPLNNNSWSIEYNGKDRYSLLRKHTQVQEMVVVCTGSQLTRGYCQLAVTRQQT